MFLKGKKKSGLRSALLAAAFVIVIAVVIIAISGYSDDVDERSFTIVSNSVKRAAVQCYALEGRYPPTIDYLRENYGLAVDDDKYSVQYRFIGDNIMPDITVLEKGAAYGD